MATDVGNSERQVVNNRTDPPDGAGVMDDERELPDAGGHDHGACVACMGMGIPCVGVWPVRCSPARSRTRTMAPIPNTFTQRGVPGGESWSGSVRTRSRA